MRQYSDVPLRYTKHIALCPSLDPNTLLENTGNSKNPGSLPISTAYNVLTTFLQPGLCFAAFHFDG
jgi:hypothetical protein